MTRAWGFLRATRVTGRIVRQVKVVLSSGELKAFRVYGVEF